MNYQTVRDPFGKISTTIRRTTDGAFIPQDLGNVDYLAYLEWVKQGNTPEECTLE